MAKNNEHRLAIQFRKEGKSYSQIKKLLGISKSTLSNWLKNMPLSKARIRELRDWNSERIEKYRNTCFKKREKRLQLIYNEQRPIILPFSERDLFISGLFLYWGEGSKTRSHGLAVTNTDPAVLKFFIRWLNKCWKINKTKLKICLHLYKDMNAADEIKYWLNELKLSSKQLLKPYIKNSNKSDLDRKGGFGHGTCSIRIDNARLAEKVLIGLKIIRDNFGNTMRP